MDDREPMIRTDVRILAWLAVPPQRAAACSSGPHYTARERPVEVNGGKYRYATKCGSR